MKILFQCWDVFFLGMLTQYHSPTVETMIKGNSQLTLCGSKVPVKNW